jgi:hypothetical protein
VQLLLPLLIAVVALGHSQPPGGSWPDPPDNGLRRATSWPEGSRSAASALGVGQCVGRTAGSMNSSST